MKGDFYKFQNNNWFITNDARLIVVLDEHRYVKTSMVITLTRGYNRTEIRTRSGSIYNLANAARLF